MQSSVNSACSWTVRAQSLLDVLACYVRRITALTGFAPTGIIVNRGAGAVLALFALENAEMSITAMSPLPLFSTIAY